MKKINYVLLIDDDEATNFYNSKVMEMAGCINTTLVFTSASEALEYLRSDKLEMLPELILLDVNLPQMDGWEFLRQFKQMASLVQKVSRVVVLSSSVNPLDRIRALEEGAVHFIQKPLTTDDLDELCGLCT